MQHIVFRYRTDRSHALPSKENMGVFGTFGTEEAAFEWAVLDRSQLPSGRFDGAGRDFLRLTLTDYEWTWEVHPVDSRGIEGVPQHGIIANMVGKVRDDILNLYSEDGYHYGLLFNARSAATARITKLITGKMMDEIIRPSFAHVVAESLRRLLETGKCSSIDLLEMAVDMTVQSFNADSANKTLPPEFFEKRHLNINTVVNEMAAARKKMTRTSPSLKFEEVQVPVMNALRAYWSS